MDLSQCTALTKFLFGRIVATTAHPQPLFQWISEQSQSLKTAWSDWGVDIPALNNEVKNSLDSLILILDFYIKNIPNLTRSFHNSIESFFTHADRIDKMELIAAALPNENGDAGSTDNWTSIQHLVKNRSFDVLLYAE